MQYNLSQKTYADFVELYLNMSDEPDDMHTIAINAKKEFNLASAEAHAFPGKMDDNLKHWWTRTWKIVKSVRCQCGHLPDVPNQVCVCARRGSAPDE